MKKAPATARKTSLLHPAVASRRRGKPLHPALTRAQVLVACDRI